MVYSVKIYVLGIILTLIGGNLVKEPSYDELSCCRLHGTSIDCLGCQLSSLPLSLMHENTTYLDLYKNIVILPEGSFENMTSLQTLKLGNVSQSQDLNSKTFRGLESLHHFEIGKCPEFQKDPNKQYYHAEVFSPLINVRTLRLNCLYPDKLELGFLQHMHDIESFTVKIGQNASLGEEFGQLENLKSLTIIPGLKIATNFRSTRSYVNITDKTLAHVPHIEKLPIEEVLVSMSPNALRPFTNLSELNLIMNKEFPLEDAFVAIKNMKSATLTKLILDGSHNDLKFLAITADMINSSNFEKITMLSLQNTRVLEIDCSIIFKFPSLRYFNIGFNSVLRHGIKGGNCSLYSLIRRPSEMAHIMNSIRIEILSLNAVYSGVTDRHFKLIYRQNNLDINPQPPKWIKVPKNLTIERTKKDFINLHSTETLKFIPPMVRYVNAKNIPSHQIKMSHNMYTALDNSILHMDLSHSKGPQNVSLFIGFNRIQAIDLKGCGIKYLHKDQLLHLPSLKYFNLTRNQLDLERFVQMNKEGSKLKWLDLSFNNLKSLPIDLLTGMTTLKSVSFRGNPLVTVDLNIHDNIDLEMLDFSDCALDNITESFMYELDNFQANKTKNLMVNFSGNQFECSCSSISMIRWFQETEVTIIDRGNISCTYQNTSIAILTLDYDEVTKDCASAPVDLCTVRNFSTINGFIP